MRSDVEFEGFGGVVLRGWLFVPEEAAAPVPGVVMAHGFSGVKEQLLDRYAEVFCAAGLAVLLYDHRNFGTSDGEPRQQINPWAQARDYRHAIDWLGDRAEVDADRLALWGTSFSGGQVIVIGAIDKRVRAVVANVPFVGLAGSDYTRDEGRFASIRSAVSDLSGEGPADNGDVMGPLALIEEEGVDVPVMFAGSDAARLFKEWAGDGDSTWQNRVTVQSAFGGEPAWDPGVAVAHLEAPLLMVVAGQDSVAPAALALAAFERAPEPKRLEVLDCPHFEAYTGHWFDSASLAMSEFLLEHLLG
ncbi:MAG: hypothetical protein JJLCMIEE_03560 [Acidimicrobiales bacterium]|nr:MAG: alpha/beta hydrolase [Actinomycetota bacterium]MBV6510419.1 hypothetical protein [Acidimicrobiales bacterium]RIK02546.1 MAG: acetylxylan esterase [Acidobacteriota bacterium]